MIPGSRSMFYLISIIFTFTGVFCGGKNSTNPEFPSLKIISIEGESQIRNTQLYSIIFTIKTNRQNENTLHYDWAVSNGTLRPLNPANRMEFIFSRTGIYLVSCTISDETQTKNIIVTVSIYKDSKNIIKWMFSQPYQNNSLIEF